MEDNGGSKVSGIRQIVKLKEMLQKWQSVALGPRAKATDRNNGNGKNNTEEGEPRSSPGLIHGGIPPAVCKRLRSAASYCDSDEESSQSPEPARDVPKGYLAVYVGPELQLRRFIVPTTYLTHPLFKVLLEKVEEEFGFDHCGGITIPCEVETFKYLVKCMETHQNDHFPRLENGAAGTSLTIEE